MTATVASLFAQATPDPDDNLLVQTFDYLRDQANYRGPNGITQRLLEHAQISFVAVAVAVLIAVPISLWLGHKRRFGLLIINVSNVGRAVPSFAILVVGNELLGRQEKPIIGIVAVFLALVALAVPPIVTNTYVGVAEVPDEVRDAARGMGLSEGQILRRVEVPLALPLVMAGIAPAPSRSSPPPPSRPNSGPAGWAGSSSMASPPAVPAASSRSSWAPCSSPCWPSSPSWCWASSSVCSPLVGCGPSAAPAPRRRWPPPMTIPARRPPTTSPSSPASPRHRARGDPDAPRRPTPGPTERHPS